MRTFGTVSFDANLRSWVIACEPHVAIRLKRVFAKLSSGSFGQHKLSDTPENARDLEWFLSRYPMQMMGGADARVRDRSFEHKEGLSVAERLLDGRIPPPKVDLSVPLRDYQQRAVAMLLQMKRLLIGDDLGIGKTAEAIGLFTEPAALPALVVTLTALPTQWRDEIARFAPKLRVHILRKSKPYPLNIGDQTRRASQLALPAATPDIIIANYHKLGGWAETLAGVVRGVVFDEAQELRLADSQKYSAALHIANAATYVCGLTATPIYNNGAEFHSVMSVIRPDSLGTRAEFVREWCTDGGGDGRERIRDPKAFGVHVREQGMMLRRTRAEVGRELPAVTRVPHEVEADLSALEQVSDACRELALFIVGRGKSPLRPSVDGHAKGEHMLASEELSNKLRQATGIAKAPYVAEFVRMLVEQGENVVLFGWHRAVYDIWLEKLKELSPAMYTGTETVAEKEAAKRRFVEGDARILIMSLRAGAGLDGLQRCCRTVCFGELDWAYGVHEQNIGRVHRDGQTDPVVAYYLIANTGSDPIVVDTLGIKRDQLSGIINPDHALIEKLQSDPDRIKRLAEAYLAQREGRAREAAAQ